MAAVWNACDGPRDVEDVAAYRWACVDIMNLAVQELGDLCGVSRSTVDGPSFPFAVRK